MISELKFELVLIVVTDICTLLISYYLVSLDSDSDISKELYRLCALMFFKTLNWNTEVHISNSASTAVTELKTFLFQF